MDLKSYISIQSFTEGFPQGDTFLDLNKIDFEDFEFTDEKGVKLKRTKLKSQDGKEYYCPSSVLRELGKIQYAGGVKARVTRVGKDKNDTRYTVVEVK